MSGRNPISRQRVLGSSNTVPEYHARVGLRSPEAAPEAVSIVPKDAHAPLGPAAAGCVSGLFRNDLSVNYLEMSSFLVLIWLSVGLSVSPQGELAA